MKIYLSTRPKDIGGGINTFSWLFKNQAKKNGHKIVSRIYNAELAIVIAHFAEEDELEIAGRKGCYILHRLDEYFEKNEDDARKKKHQKIISLNKLTNVTVFQSQFVFDNVYPYIKPPNYRIIHNGSDPKIFYPVKKTGGYIGHVTWSTHPKKRLDLLHKFIKKHPEEKFLLIGNHAESSFNFNLPNVVSKGRINRKKIAAYYRMMKFLYFPSEKDPCSNTVVEAILSAVPVCYNPVGGNVELTKNCGEPLDKVDHLLKDFEKYRCRCFKRDDLYFNNVFEKYLSPYYEAKV